VTSSVQTQLDNKAPSSTAVTLTGTQTLTNKTLTSPVLTTPTISTVDAKGDLLVGTADNTVDRLVVGNNGETLVADSSTSTGLRYTAGNPVPNPVINSCFDIWQRGTSLAVTAGSATFYGPDRWQTYSAASGRTISRQATNDTTNLPNVQYCARVQRDSGNTATNFIQVSNMFETANSVPFAGQTITYSFYARAGANFSSASSGLGVQFVTGTGVDQNATIGYTGVSIPINTTATLTTTWQRFTYTATLATNVSEMSLSTYYTPVGTAGAADYYEITGVQLDRGSVALPLRRNGATIQGELSACQRYYVRIGGSALYEPFGAGFGWSGTRAGIQVKLPTTMRTVPSALDFATPMTVSDSNTATTVTTASLGDSGKDVAIVRADVASGLTQYRPYNLAANNSTSAYVGFSAEL
jgi:hypothetical protein